MGKVKQSLTNMQPSNVCVQVRKVILATKHENEIQILRLLKPRNAAACGSLSAIYYFYGT